MFNLNANALLALPVPTDMRKGLTFKRLTDRKEEVRRCLFLLMRPLKALHMEHGVW